MKSICPICQSKFKRLMRHIREIHPTLYVRECDKAIEMFESGMSLRDIGKSDYTLWAFGAALSKLIKANVSSELIQYNKTTKISEKLRGGYDAGIYNLKGRGRKKKDNIIYNSISAHPTEILIWKGKPLIKENILDLTEPEVEQLKCALVQYIQSCNFLEHNYRINELHKDFLNLSLGEIQHNGDTITNISSVGNKIYKYFFPNMLKVKGGYKPSVVEALLDREILNKILDNRLSKNVLPYYSGNITKNMIVQGAKASGYAFGTSQFKPLIAKYIYNEYVKDGYNVLDYSCGFGGRLLGLMATNKKAKYFGYEPNLETYSGLIKMSEFFDFPIDIKQCGSEAGTFDEKMDFIFSSPPYFNTELYSDEITQSYNKYPVYDEWLEKYWKQTVTNIKFMLNRNSVFAINVGNDGNKKMKKIDHDMNTIILEEGFDLIRTMTITTPMSHLANKTGQYQTKNEYVYFYQLSV